MKKHNLHRALFVALFILTSTSVYAEGIQLIGEDTKTLVSKIREQGIMATFDQAHGSVERPVPQNSYIIPEGQERWQARTGSAKDLVNYLKKVEALNPGANWQQIVTRLHHFAYPNDGNYTMFDIPLFKEGAENQGWQEIKLPFDEDLPFFIQDADSNLVNFKHALCGLRASLNRIGSDRAIWMRVNTSFGDQYQVWDERKRIIQKDSCALLPGVTKSWVDACKDYANQEDAITAGEYMSKLDNASRWYTEDQRLGNKLSFTLEKKLRKGTASSLSDAVEKTFID